MEVKHLEHDEGFTKIDGFVKNGLPKGQSIGWPNIDENFKILKGQLNVVSGYPSSGKSEFVENIACFVARTEKYNVTMYAPESYPPERHQMSLIEKLVGKPVLDRGYGKPMTEDERIDAYYTLTKQFTIISADEEAYSFENILDSLDERCKGGETIDMVVIDPWNEMESGRPNGTTETDYIGLCLMKARRLARKHNISFWIVCHPAKPAQKDKDGSYPPPDLYDLSGSSHWRNKADNGIIVHRYDLSSTRVHVLIRKIKNRFYGKPGEVFFNFLPSCGRYEPAHEEL